MTIVPTILLAIFCGVLVGWTLATLGGGGSLFVLPALVFLMDLSIQEAARIAQVIVGATSLLVLWHYYRQRQVNWRVAITMAFLGIAGVYCGDATRQFASESVAMISLAAVLLLTSFLMWQKSRRSSKASDSTANKDAASSPPALSHSFPIIFSGLVAGFMMGFLAIGGGFIIVPALVLATHMEMKTAIGTSLAIITINSLSGIATTISTEGIHTTRWELAIPFLAGSLLTGVIASRRATKISNTTQQRMFASLTTIIAVMIIVKWLAENY